MAVTIKDVARAANVSVASVSRALNGSGTVTEETRKLVLAAARSLRYIPHSGARSLSTSRTQTIGVVLPDLHGEFFSELIRGIDMAAHRRGLHLLVSSSHGDAGEAALAMRAMSGRVDGLIVMSPHVDAGFLADNLADSLPIVLLNTRATGHDCSALAVDNHGGAADMVQHLVEMGHRSIVMIAGPADNFESQERLRGFRETMARLLPGVPAFEPDVLRGDFGEESGYRAGQQLRALKRLPDAVFAANDMMAIGCLFALGEGGLVVPRDIALAGFDDVPTARFVTPPLTTVRVRITEMGSRALECLAFEIENPQGTKKTVQVVQTELVVRRSCGAHAQGVADTDNKE
ncbi:LacI family DNA-binding transcriptional regulator [Massilia scottii]|uniref:LacI family DNA-binding transcriptional regulator n=1 Tax=Massilia scottii TaxID=3057166 RepID=UPI002796B768|nr:LacI family DNA-binding transcriptional regulator [Massilia sp. CCM 9029]MDQ1832362.1 LacI family DNA-binding transcriptional regulator [Massilia sp. CCM 9029]